MRLIDFKAKLIDTEIEITLETYPKIYQTIFGIPELRQQLVSYIYHKLPGCCLVIEYGTIRQSIKQNFSFSSQEFGLEVETHVRDGIDLIFEENKQLIAEQSRKLDRLVNEFDPVTNNIEGTRG